MSNIVFLMDVQDAEVTGKPGPALYRHLDLLEMLSGVCQSWSDMESENLQ